MNRISMCVVAVLTGGVLQARAAEFGAEGVTKPDLLKTGTRAVTVRFDRVPYELAFDLPGRVAYVTAEGVRCDLGGAETLDPACEGPAAIRNDRKLRYARTWIQSQNPARVLVRVSGALCDRRGRIAHRDVDSGSKYGKGDWAEEWHFIYPDGWDTRTVRVLSGLASRAVGVRGIRGRVPFECSQTMISRDAGVAGLLESKALTLLKLDGTSRPIDLTGRGPNEDLLPGANIQIINLTGSYRPFVATFGKGAAIRAHHGDVVGLDPKRDLAISRILETGFYQRKADYVTCVYLSGLIPAVAAGQQARAVLPLVRSWLTPPAPDVLTKGYVGRGYSALQRAYIVDRGSRTQDGLVVELAASEAKPAVNPVFVVRRWSEPGARVYVNGLPLGRRAFRVGLEKASQRNDLVVWIEGRWTTKTQFGIRPAS